jgi:hypothetical protein
MESENPHVQSAEHALDETNQIGRIELDPTDLILRV